MSSAYYEEEDDDGYYDQDSDGYDQYDDGYDDGYDDRFEEEDEEEGFAASEDDEDVVPPVGAVLHKVRIDSVARW